MFSVSPIFKSALSATSAKSMAWIKIGGAITCARPFVTPEALRQEAAPMTPSPSLSLNYLSLSTAVFLRLSKVRSIHYFQS
jgi:hypothetical protein